jgi:hypothetical protein
MAVVMRKLEVVKFLEERLAAIERERYDELASEDAGDEADARAGTGSALFRAVASTTDVASWVRATR